MTEKRKSDSVFVRFASNFDYTWPSRAVTAYKAGWSGRVPGVVARKAKAAGALDETRIQE